MKKVFISSIGLVAALLFAGCGNNTDSAVPNVSGDYKIQYTLTSLECSDPQLQAEEQIRLSNVGSDVETVQQTGNRFEFVVHVDTEGVSMTQDGVINPDGSFTDDYVVNAYGIESTGTIRGVFTEGGYTAIDSCLEVFENGAHCNYTTYQEGTRL